MKKINTFQKIEGRMVYFTKVEERRERE